MIMTPDIIIKPYSTPSMEQRRFEMCEHKGIGHPDTMTDAVCEAAACELASLYEREFGQALHFNVDKGLLVAGRSEPRFGGGRILKWPKIIICGRATNPGGKLDLSSIVSTAARRYLEETIRADTRHFLIETEIETGSNSLQQVYAVGRKVALANDTSFGVGFAPFSDLEQKVLQLAVMLKSPELRRAFPALGDDFKIMGLRRGDDFTFTIAVAMIDRYVEGVDQYFEIKRKICEYLLGRLNDRSELHINALDNPDAKDESGLYLTVSGLSAEQGDDGQVGRGNRVNGLITPGRAMSLEAAAGKNPVAHVGKIYNVLAHQIAQTICQRVPDVSDVTVQLLSRIGQPIDRPQAVAVELSVNAEQMLATQDLVTTIVRNHFEDMASFTARLARGELPVF